jgi:outer membrane protein OmpA-like peptidoglycan-associated protein
MRTHFLAVSAVLALASTAAPSASHAQTTTKMNGVIVARAGADMVVRAQGATTNTTVVLSDSTKVKVKKGALGLRKSSMGMAALIPGLRVEVQGTPGAHGAVNATQVEFSSGDLKTANEIQAGVNPTAQQAEANAAGVAANQAGVAADKAETDSLSARFGQLGDYDIVGQDTVYFAVNSSTISAAGQAALKALAAKAKTFKAYNIQVAGYTDASGNAQYNQELSENRAQAVIEYLEQQCDVPLYLVLAPAAMGFSHPAASNETASGAAQNRRVVASILVNRGVTGQ